MRLLSIVLSCFIFFSLSTPVRADLNLDTPQVLLARAALNKNELRQVINDIDLNLSEMRDQSTFEKYFFMLDDLQALAVKMDLDSIYPNAVRKVGNRMVQKGVNWLDILKTSQAHLLYYEKWMTDYQTASSLLYTAGLQIKDETNLDRLKIGADNLEALMKVADQMWPNEKALRLLFRTTLSDLASKVLKTEKASDDQTEFWLAKIYTPDAMSEFTTLLQGQVFDLTALNAKDIHWILRRLVLVFNHSNDPAFGAPESLNAQIGDSGVDLILKSFRLQEPLTDLEWSQLFGMMQTRHYVALAAGWASFGKVPRGVFADYYLKRAYQFVALLQNRGLTAEALAVSQSIDKKTAAINGHQDDIEGTWMMTDNRGVQWRLVMAFTADDTIFASFGDAKESYVRPFYNVIFDMKLGRYVAAERSIDADRATNRLIRFTYEANGTLKVFDSDAPLKPLMIAKRVQTYPDLMKQAEANMAKAPSPPLASSTAAPSPAPGAPSMDGTYQGMLTIPGGRTSLATLTITVFSGASVGNLQMLNGQYNSTFNFGTPADNGAVYLTHGGITGSGTWMQIRAMLGADGILRGYTIYGGSGMVPIRFAMKKVR